MQRLTPWFTDEDPVRAGVYMVDQSRGDDEQCVYSFYDGQGNWYPQDSTPDKALRWICYGPKINDQFKKWRGVMK